MNPDPIKEKQYLSQEDYDAKLKTGVKNLINKGYKDDDIKLYIKSYKNRYGVEQPDQNPTETPIDNPTENTGQETPSQQASTEKKAPTTPRAKTDPRFNPDFVLSPNKELVKERNAILDEYDNLPPMQVNTSELDARLADVESRIEQSMTRKSNYKVGKEKIAEIEKQQNEIEAKAYNAAKANNLDPMQILETDGTYQALKNQRQTEQDLIALDEAVLEKVAEDTNADTGAMAFVKRIGRAFGIQDEAEQTLELDDKIQEQILLGLGGDLREKEKIANGYATLREKEDLITQAKVNVFKNERNRMKAELENLKEADIPDNEKIERWKDLRDQNDTLTGIVGWDAAESMIKNSFDKSKVSNDFQELIGGDGFLASTADAASTFLQEMYSIGFKSSVGFVADVMAGAGDTFTDQDRYSLYDAFSDTVYNIGDFQIAPNSQAEGTRIVDEEGDFNINWKTASKTLAQTLPFSLQIINDVKKGKISGLQKSMGKLLNPTKSAKIADELTMLDSAFRATFSDNIKQGQELGLDDNQARVFAGVLSAAEGMAQKIMPDTNFLGTNAGKVLVENFKGNLKSAATKKAMGTATKNFFKNFVMEVGEEEAVALMQDLTKFGMVATHENSEFWDMKAQKELMAATLLMSGALGAKGLKQDIKANKLDFYTQVADNIKGIEQQFQAELNDPNISDEQRAELEEGRQYANDIRTAIDRSPQKVTQEHIDLLIEKQRLMRENETLDKAFQTKNQKRIAEIDEQLSGGLDAGRGNTVVQEVVNRIKGLFDFALQNKGKYAKESVRSVNKEEAETLSQLTGVKIDEGFEHTIDSSAINHIINKHGNAEQEAKQGQIAVTQEDFTLIPEIIDNYDTIEYGGKNNRGLDTIKYTKTFEDGTTYVIEEIRTGRKSLALNTMYKRKDGELSSPDLTPKNVLGGKPSDQMPKRKPSFANTNIQKSQKPSKNEESSVLRQQELRNELQADEIETDVNKPKAETQKEVSTSQQSPNLEVEQNTGLPNQGASNQQQSQGPVNIKLGKTKKATTYSVQKNDKGILEVTAPKGKKVSRPNDVLYKYADEVADLTQGERYTPQPEQRPRDADVEAARQSQNPAELAEIALRTKTDEYIEANTDPATTAIVNAMVGKVNRQSYINFGDANNIGQQMALTYFGNQSGTGAMKPRSLDQIAQEVSQEVGREVEPQELVELMERYPNGMDSVTKEVRDQASNEAKQRFTEITGLPNSDRFLQKAVEQQVKAEQLTEQMDALGSLYQLSDQELLDLQSENEQAEQKIYGSQANQRAEERNTTADSEADEGGPRVQSQDRGQVPPSQERQQQPKVNTSKDEDLNSFLDSLKAARNRDIEEHIDISNGGQKQLETDIAEVEKEVKSVPITPKGKKAKPPKKVDSRIIDEFVEAKTIDVVGKKVKNVQDIADLYLIHRSPKIEKGHVIYVKKGKIVHAQAETLGLPYATSIAANRPDLVRGMAKKVGADKVYLLHNHPSGNHKPSEQDVEFTVRMGRALQGTGLQMEHVIIDTTKFTKINRDGTTEEMDYKNKPKPLFKKRKNLEFNLDNLVEVAEGLSKGGAPHHVIYLSSNSDINANEIIDGSEGNLKNHIEKNMKEFGARHFVVVTDGSNASVNAIKDTPMIGKLEFLQIKNGKGEFTGSGPTKNEPTSLRDGLEIEVLYEDAPSYKPFPLANEGGINETYVPSEVSNTVRNAILEAENNPNVTTKEAALKLGRKAMEETVFYQNLTPPEKNFLRRNFIETVFNGQPIAPKIEQQVSGIKKDLMPETAAANTEVEKRDLQETLERGKRIAESMDMPQLVDELLVNPRALQADETAAMVYYKTTLDNKSFEVSEDLLKAYENNDESKAAQLEYELRKLEKLIEDYEQVAIKTAYEQGLALYVRRMLLTNKYTLAKQIAKAKVTGGGKIPKHIENKLKDLSEQLKKNEQTIKKLEKEKADLEDQIENSLDPEEKELNELLKYFAENELPNEPDLLKETDSEAKYKRMMELLGKRYSDPDALAVKLRQQNISEDKFNKIAKGFKPSKSRAGTNNKAKQPYVDKDGLLRLPTSYIKNVLQATGIDKISDLTEYVYNDVQKLGIDVTERQVRDLITDYGKTSEMSKEEIDVRLRKLRRVGKLISGIEDARSGKRPKRSGLQRDKPTDKERKLQRELKELIKDIPIDDKEADRQWKSALDGIKSRLQNQIVDLNQQIKDREKKKPNKPVELDAEAERLKEQVRDLKEQLEKIVGKPERSNEARVKAAMAQAERSIEDLENRIKNKDFSPRAGDPIPLTPELEARREKVKQLKAKYDKMYEESLSDDEKTARAAEKRAKQLWTQYTKLKDKVDRRELKYNEAKRDKITSPQIEATKKLIEEKKQELERMREAEGILEQRKMRNYKRNLERSIDNYKERIKNKDFAPKTKPPRSRSVDEKIRQLEIEKAQWKFEFDKLQIEWQLENRSRSAKAIDTLLDILNLPRSLMASADMSAPLRQGLILSLRNPKIAMKAAREMWRQTWSKEKHDKWIQEIQASDEYVLMKDAGLYLSEPTAELTAREERFVSRLANKAKWVPYSERAYVGYLNAIRVGVFNHMADKLAKNKKDYSPDTEKGMKAHKDLANFINNASGRGSLKNDAVNFEDYGPMLSAMFFSPRYLVSRFNLLNPINYAKMSPPVRQEALYSMFTFLGTGMTILALAAAMGAEVEDDPRSADFGKIKIGDKRFDVWAGFQQWAVLFARFGTGEMKSSTTGNIRKLDGTKFPFTTRFDLIENFIRGKSAPVPSTAWDLMEGKNIVGENVTLGDEIMEMIRPIYFADIAEMWEDNAAFSEYASVLIPNFFGVSVQRYSSDDGDDGKKDNKKEGNKPNITSLK